MSIAVDGGWADFRADLMRRTRRPLSHVTFVMHFLLSVVAIGGLGLWVELLNYSRAGTPENLMSVRTAIATFFPALIGSTCLQMILGSFLKQLRIFALLFTVTFAVIGFWLIFDRGMGSASALLIGTFASLCSLWFWWIANADNPDFQDETLAPSAAVGGRTDRDLDGDLKGFDA
jgi:hypothetical protein